MDYLKLQNKTKNPLNPSVYCDVCSVTMNDEKKNRYFHAKSSLDSTHIPVTLNTPFISDCECVNFQTKSQCDVKLNKPENWKKISTWTSCQENNRVNLDCLKLQLDMVDTGEPVNESFANLWRDIGGISTKSNMKPLIKQDSPLYVSNASEFFGAFETGRAQERVKERICFEL